MSGLAGDTAGSGDDLARGMVIGEFEVIRYLGAGAMGTVYEAHHRVLGKRTAIKVMNSDLSRDADAVARFRREARAVAQLATPHIVAAFGFGELPDGRSYYVMELLAGESLRERIERGRIPLEEALEIFVQLARGLEVTHDARIVHRDLKPENIFLSRTHTSAVVVKLLDFGLVKFAHADDAGRTNAGIGFGTPLYAAPEQLRSARDVDARADIYSLGCVMFEAILGQLPFTASTVAEVIAAHLTAEPPAPASLWPEIPTALAALLAAMLAKDPSRRPPIGHVQDVLERVRASADRQLITVVSVPPAQRRVRWPVLDVAICTVVVALLVTTNGSRTSPTPALPAAEPSAATATSQVESLTPLAPSIATTTEASAANRATETTSGQTVSSKVSGKIHSRTSKATTSTVSGAATATPSVAPAPPVPASKPTQLERNQTINPFAKRRSP